MVIALLVVSLETTSSRRAWTDLNMPNSESIWRPVLIELLRVLQHRDTIELCTAQVEQQEDLEKQKSEMASRLQQTIARSGVTSWHWLLHDTVHG